MAMPDNRLRFPSTRIDFEMDVGVAGQDHDSFPAPGQARYDHMRLFLIALLAQQASFDEPSQYRDGTPWFDLNTFTLKIRSGSEWVSYADTIALTEPDDDGQVVTLANWYASVKDALVGISPEVVFSGSCTVDGVNVIPIPDSVQSALNSESRVFCYIGGALVNPHNCSLVGSPTPTTIRLSNIVLNDGDTFTVVIRRISATTYLETSVVIP